KQPSRGLVPDNREADWSPSRYRQKCYLLLIVRSHGSEQAGPTRHRLRATELLWCGAQHGGQSVCFPTSLEGTRRVAARYVVSCHEATRDAVLLVMRRSTTQIRTSRCQIVVTTQTT